MCETYIRRVAFHGFFVLDRSTGKGTIVTAVTSPTTDEITVAVATTTWTRYSFRNVVKIEGLFMAKNGKECLKRNAASRNELLVWFY